ncbi:MAG: HAD-IB family phosphatase [Bacteroidota bacterium]
MDKPIILIDFDKTLYCKDSLITFHIFCIRKYPILVIWLPVQIISWLLHKLKLISTQQFKNCYLLFLAFRSIETIKEDATTFWEVEYSKNFNPKILALLHQPDTQCVVITASPTIYLQPLLKLLPPITLIGTEVQTTNGIYTVDGKNCKGTEKVVAFRKLFAQRVTITQAYSDSLSDTPMLELAQQGFMVKGDLISPYQA